MALYKTAQDYVFGFLLLQCGFPESSLLDFEVIASYHEAVFHYNTQHPYDQLNPDISK